MNLISTGFSLSNSLEHTINGDIRYCNTSDIRPAVVVLHGFRVHKDWGFYPYICSQLALAGAIVINFNFSMNGFELDNAESPASFNANDVVKYKVSLSISTDKKALIYKRNLQVNGMVFPLESYASLKQIFDTLHTQDNHQVTLKFNAASAANGAK